MTAIDLNCDMGEFAAAVADGSQTALMRFVSSVNVACGGHAGDRDTMRSTARQAMEAGLSIGAHPGYPDRANFGRFELDMAPGELSDSVAWQVGELASLVSELGGLLTHVKPHGALYNQAAGNRELARAIVDGVARVDRGLVLVGLAGSRMLEVFREAGFAVAAEGFCDRAYEADGTLRSRRLDGALIRDPQRAAAQAVRMARDGVVTAVDGTEVRVDAATLCIHGDTPGAEAIAAAVAGALRGAGLTVRGLGRASGDVGQ